MSEYITHVAVHDDCRNLALFVEDTAAELKQSLRNHPRVSLLGSLASRGDRFTVDLLRKGKDTWPSEAAERMLAFLFGWRSHLAADRQLKTLFRLLEPQVFLTDRVDGPTEVSIYQDIFILREMYSNGEQAPFAANMLVPQHASKSINGLFVGLWQNSLLGIQAFAQGDERLESWFDKFLAQRQTFYVDAERYVTAYNQTDPEKMRYVVETHRFYDRSDPLIRLARSLQSGKPDRSIDFEVALEAAKTQSHYARALRRGCLYTKAASAFLANDIDEAELEERFDVNKPHAAREVFGALDEPSRREELLRKWHAGEGQD